MIYLALSAVFLVVACAVALTALLRVGTVRVRQLVRTWWVPMVITGIALLVLTAVFDNIMIALGFMVYSDSHVTGLSIGLAPLEDFSYPVAGLILLPALWLLCGRRPSNGSHG
ncbi:MAG: lycopene cyclase domain-containing protein [Terrimesophilobacter sp.]